MTGSFSLDVALEATSVGILCADRDARILYANKAAAAILGVPRESLIGRGIEEFSAGASPAFREIVRTGKPQEGIRIETRGGEVIADRSPVVEGGRVVGVLSVFKSLSRYEETAKELKAYRELARELEAVIRSSYDGLYITDGNANTVMYNKAYLRVSGLREEDVAGKNMRELIRAGTINRSATLEVLAKRRSVTIMQEFSNGRTAIVTGNPVFNDRGEIVRVVSNVRDITELCELRAQVEESRTLARRYRDELTRVRMEGILRDMVSFRSEAMERCLDLVSRVSNVASPVLLTGESGVGKGLLARAIHRAGTRAGGPFIHVNCGAIPATLMESELFGYEKGSFTGASDEGKPGLFELADRGTLFLDEVGDIALPLQVKLLKVLEEMEVLRLGGRRPRKVDVRVVAATNRDLKEMIRAGNFREDLFFRLNVFPIQVPPLRERPEDIPPLVDRILGALNRKYRKAKRLEPQTLEILGRYPFPGNVRELQNVVERAFILCDGKRIEPAHLPEEIRAFPSADAAGGGVAAGAAREQTLPAILAEVERKVLESALRKCRSTYEAARFLGIDQSTVVRKMKKYGIAASAGGARSEGNGGRPA